MRASVVIPAVILVLVAGLLWTFQRRLVYFPDAGPGAPAAAWLPGARDVTLHTADGLQLAAWFLPGPAPDSPAVLVANGNGGSRALRAELAGGLREAGCAVLLFDYRGYAGNGGSPSEEGLALDVRAARAYLLGEVGVAPGRLVYLGESLGAAVVTELAAEHPPAGLVLRSPFTALADVGRAPYSFLPVRLLLRDRYPVAEHIRRVHVPTTVVYGTADTVVPPGQSQAVAAAAPVLHRLVAVPGADHNDPVLVDGPEVVRAVAELAGLL